jgi:hypothetical protein
VSDSQSEFERHSFVVKIWLEEFDGTPGQAKWRGHVTHVGTQERQYVERLEDISSFIRRYLVEMGARLDVPDDEGKG